MPIDKGRVHNNDKPEKHDEYAGEQTGNGWRIVPNKDTGRRELRHEQTIRFSNISKDVVKRVAYERFGIAEDSWLIGGCRYSYGSCNHQRAVGNFKKHDPTAPCLVPQQAQARSE